ncbi:hypothetical protein VSU19_21655 [Verrucomicrobiales bacterium BCK34]|nr:hypothetical protein [Verrucomicrobiales bacterium BCK34]
MAIIPACLLFLFHCPATGQNQATPVVAESTEAAPPEKENVPEEPSDAEKSVDALSSVLESIKTNQNRIKELNSALAKAPEVEKEAINKQIRDLTAVKTELKSDFEAIATGIDTTEYDQSTEETFVLGDELDSILEPIIAELKDLTEKPREIEALRSDLASWQKRLTTTETALVNLSGIPSNTEGELRTNLAETRQKWTERKNQAENRIQAITYQLEQAERNKPSFLTTISEGFRGFFRSRGQNFLLCFVVFFLTYFLFRFLHQRLDRLAPWRRKGKRPFYIRLIDVGLNVFSLIGAVIASLIVLYATGDWVLMGLAIIILVGVILAAKNSLPKFYDHARILLNLGEVREGERVIVNGLPWRVERLSFYSILINDHLRGGLLRLPVRALADCISRPISEEGEMWFPCHEGDWVELPDEGRGRVIAQTPEYVQLVKLGGAKITIPTTDFLAKAPKNLSQNFRIKSTFGIDYKHQADCTGKIPEILWAYITKGIYTLLEDNDSLLSLKVEFASAGASSLDYEIIADFDGIHAPRYEALSRAMQRLAVECCNENGWEIPFTQITLHNAYPGADEPEETELPTRPKLP